MKPSTKSKFLFFLLISIIANISTAFAQVDISPTTAGQTISNELSTGGSTPGYTTLGNITIAEKDAGDFAAGINRTLTFNAPTGWRFLPSNGSASGSGTNISAVSVTSVNAAIITVRYTVTGSTDGTNSITISGIQVQSTIAAVGPERSIYRSGGDGVINGLTAGAENIGTPISPLGKIAGNFKYLQVLLPGQNNAPGTATGRSGLTTVLDTAGTGIAVTVNAVDFGYNITTHTGNVVSLTSTGPYATIPAPQAISGGKTTFNVVLKTYTTSTFTTITAKNETDNAILDVTSSNIRVYAAAYEKLLTLFPGETLDPGSPTGKTGFITAPTAGVNYNVIVYSVDAFWNRSTSTNTISIASDATNFGPPANAALSGGARSRTLLFKVAGETPNVTTTDVTDGLKTEYIQLLPAVQLGAFVKLQLLLPGETAAPGTVSGKKGAPSAQSAGVAFDVTVNAVDANWNVITTVTDEVSITGVNPAYASTSDLPDNQNLLDGTATFSVKLDASATNHQLRATDISTPAISVSTSPLFTVNAGPFTQLLTILPGETYLPGDVAQAGKTGSINSVTANANLTVTVRAVDAFFNTVASVTDVVNLTTTNPNGTFTSNALPLVNGTTNFIARLPTAGNTSTITVTNASLTETTTTKSITVTTGAFTKLVLMLPGELDEQGIAAGKSGAPTAQVAGIPFTVRVKASDAFGNTVTSVTDLVRFTATSDVYAKLPADTNLVNGYLETTATYRLGNTTNNRRLTVSNLTEPGKTASASPYFTVGVGAYAGLLVIVPGETYTAGHPDGKVNLPNNQVPNAAFSITVRAVDAAFNTVTSINDQVSISSSDGAATLPLMAPLVSGVKADFSVALQNNGSFTASSFTTPGKTSPPSAVVIVTPGTFVKLQLLLPGETAAPGTVSGKTGSPDPISVGSPIAVTVNAVDAAWNVITSITDEVAITNVNAAYNTTTTLPANKNLVAGTNTFSVTFKQAATNHQLRASDITAPTKTASTSPVFTVSPGAFTKLLVILPGETYVPGTVLGKTGGINSVAVNANITVTVRAVDGLSNTVSSTDVVKLTSNDVNAVFTNNNLPLVAGIRNFNARLTTAGNTTTITASDTTSNTKTPYTTAAITVNAGAFSKYVIVLPGESSVEGTVAGKSGTPLPQVAGEFFNVWVKATDAFGNTISSINDMVTFTATNDVYAQLPPNAALVNGMLATTATYRIGSPTNNRRINVANVADPSKIGSSSLFTVNTGTVNRLLIVLPGETYTAGHPDGKVVNILTSQTANVPFNITVRAVDKAWNMVTSVGDSVKITSNVLANLPPNLILVNGIRTNIPVSLSTTGKLTAADKTNPAVLDYTTSDINITIGSYVKLQLLLPGETAAPGTVSGKTGTPTPRTAGVSFKVRVNAVDASWNVVSSVSNIVGITNINTAFNATSTIEANKALVSGTGEFDVIEKTAATNHQLRATDATASFTVNSALFTVSPSGYTRLLIVLPGETYLPGQTAGKTGPINPVAANANLTVNVRAVDAFSNTVTSVTDVVNLSTTDPSGTFTSNNLGLIGGTRNFTARLATAGNTATITVTDVPVSKTYTTGTITVTAGAFTRLVLVMPGERDSVGIAAGKTGSPTNRVAGVPFTIKVRATDNYGNTITSVNHVVTFSATNDPYAVLPANTALINGVLTTDVTYRTAGTLRRLTATDFTDNTKTASISTRFDVNVGPYVKLLVVLPGETYTPGAPTGKLNPPANQAANLAFNVAVRAVDVAFNQVNTVTDVVTISSFPLGATFTPTSAALVNGMKTDFSVKLTVSSTITATSADGTKSPYTTGTILVVGATATNHFFRSTVSSGNWNNSSTWESSSDNSTWQPATITPTNVASGILVRNGNTVDITASVSVDDVLIESGAQVNVTGGNLSIANGTASPHFIVAGTLRNNGRTITTTGALQIAATGKYQHNFTTSSGTIPTANWIAGSVIEILGYTSFASDVLGSNQSFSDFVWNAPNQNALGSPSLLSNFSARNFTVVSTGAGTLNLSDAGSSTVITGNYTQTAGKVVVNKTSGTQNLSVAGNFAVNGGSFALGNGTVNLTFNGSSAQSLANAGPAIDFQNVTFTNGGTKTLTSGAFNLVPTGVLTMGASTTLNANGKLNLRSVKTSTATIASIPSGSSITGSVRVERFISGGSVAKFRTYRMLSSPTHNGSHRYSFTEFKDDMYVTGKGGAANDFDESTGNAASAFTYNAGFKDVEDITATIPVGTGAYMFFRGNRSGTAGKLFPTFVDPEDVTMDFSGTLNQQNVNVALIPNGNLVGNPYASSIDWNSAGITKTNLQNNVIRIWNPATRTYATYDGLTSANGGSNVIPSGQGFFVQAALAGSASLTFTESAKINSQPSTLLLSAPINERLTLNNETIAWGNNDNQILNAAHTELRLTLAANASSFKDETVLVFKAGKSAAFNVAEDASYFSGGAEQKVFLASRSSDNRDLVINYMPEVSAVSLVKLNIIGLNRDGNSGNVNGNYKLALVYNGLPTGYIVKLNDAFLGTTVVAQNGDIYNFSIDNAVPATFGPNRFSVSFNAPTTLPVTLTSFIASKVNEGVTVNWKSETEINHNRYELERAGDDQLYTKLITTAAKGNGSSYSFLDKLPLLGNNYYRLVQVSNDNKSITTAPIVINYNGGVDNELISIFPNPVVAQFTVKYNGSLNGVQQTVKITNISGQVVYNQTISTSSLTSGYSVNIGNYAAGLYMVEIFENGNQKVGQTKLIKQ